MAANHTRDTDCTVDPRTRVCTDCGAEHADPCDFCEGRAYHLPDCPVMTDPAYWAHG